MHKIGRHVFQVVPHGVINFPAPLIKRHAGWNPIALDVRFVIPLPGIILAHVPNGYFVHCWLGGTPRG